ncbi:cupin domain-containing protein [Aquamicrobium zhengzhouense]|uniref:Uncharacterized protein n=1 Tax=Aquamicrobium zhengzhouense TaxID=2781738 RepID=A0ABS0SJ97_9HYPH|nr:hypothetical protein [Aquamicrobium zhengzhouense]MBI1622742.1 hypothetical protein [Aquamicrobium zhengzhouense]
MEPTKYFYDLFDTKAASTSLDGDGLTVRRLEAAQRSLSLTTPDTAEAILILSHGKAQVTGQTIQGERQLAIVAPATDIVLEPETLAYLVAPKAKTARFTRAKTLPAIYDMDRLQPPADNPRLKMLQTDAMSINWVHYQGPRDRTKLSPHSHADFSQGSLALEGNFIHHLRTPWSKNANEWRADVHVDAASPSLATIPPTVEHTTEGVGDGPHLLVDLFHPARADYIAKGWMLNANDYKSCGKQRLPERMAGQSASHPVALQNMLHGRG